MKFKRFLAIILSVMMVFGGVATVFAADEPAAEAEAVAAANPNQAAIDALTTLGVYKGGTNGDGKPTDLVTRWQMAVFAARILTGDTDDAVWKNATANTTAFPDLKGTSKDFNGAIGLVNSRKVMIGQKDAAGEVIFAPDANVTLIEVLAIAIRMLGYDTTSYSWYFGYVDKAKDLGLLNGVDLSVGYEQNATRATVAQVLYNALGVANAPTKSAFSYTQKVVMIVASQGVKFAEDNEKLGRANYVSFQVIGADGKPTGTVYSISAKEFGITDTNNAIGSSYLVATTNNFETFLSVTPAKTVKLWNEGVNKLAFKVSGSDKVVELVDAKDKYKAVDKYTNLNTYQGSKTGIEDIPGDYEILVYDPSQAIIEYKSGLYYDLSGNVLSPTTLAVVYQYIPFLNVYLKLDADGKNTLATLDDIKKDPNVAATGTGKTNEGFRQVTSLSKNAYSSLELFDDYTTYEGYDRAIYKEYGLMEYTVKNIDGADRAILKYNNDGLISSGFNASAIEESKKEKVSDIKIVNAKDYTAMTLKSGDIFTGYYNYQTKTIEVYEILSLKNGTLNGWTNDGKVTVGGTQYTANYTTYKNAAVLFDNDAKKAANTAELLKMYTMNVQYILIDDQIVYIKSGVANNHVVVLDEFIGVTATGNLKFYAYTTYKPGAREIIEVSSVYGIYNYNALVGLLLNGTIAGNSLLVDKTPYLASVNSNDGSYYLRNVSPSASATLTIPTYGKSYFGGEVTLANGKIATLDNNLTRWYVFILNHTASNGDNYKTIVAATGTVAATAYINGTFYYASKDCVVVELSGDQIPDGFNVVKNYTYVYMKSLANVTASTGGIGIGTQEVTYTNLVDIKTGSDYSATATVNLPLVAGGVYLVENGKITSAYNYAAKAELIKAIANLNGTKGNNYYTTGVIVAGQLTTGELAIGASNDTLIAAIKAAIVADSTIAGTITSSLQFFDSFLLKDATGAVYGNASYTYPVTTVKNKVTFSFVYNPENGKTVVYVTSVDKVVDPVVPGSIKNSTFSDANANAWSIIGTGNNYSAANKAATFIYRKSNESVLDTTTFGDWNNLPATVRSTGTTVILHNQHTENTMDLMTTTAAGGPNAVISGVTVTGKWCSGGNGIEKVEFTFTTSSGNFTLNPGTYVVRYISKITHTGNVANFDCTYSYEYYTFTVE